MCTKIPCAAPTGVTCVCWTCVCWVQLSDACMTGWCHLSVALPSCLLGCSLTSQKPHIWLLTSLNSFGSAYKAMRRMGLFQRGIMRKNINELVSMFVVHIGMHAHMYHTHTMCTPSQTHPFPHCTHMLSWVCVAHYAYNSIHSMRMSI